LLACLALAMLENPVSPTPLSQTRQEEPSGQTPTFHTTVTYVTTDVIVRDEEGRFVPDLTLGDFEIWEDGVKQDIASLVLVHGGVVYNRVLSEKAPQGAPPPLPPIGVAGRIFILFIDDLHLTVGNTPRTRKLIKDIATNLIHEGDMFAIVSTGPSALAIDLTYDRRVLLNAIQKVRANGLRPSEVLLSPRGEEGLTEVQFRVNQAFATASHIIEALAEIHGRRKALIFISEGYDMDPFHEAQLERKRGLDEALLPEDELSTERWLEGGRFAQADLVRLLRDLTRAANRANASFYTIDPRGLSTVLAIDEPINPEMWQIYLRDTQESLRFLATETGGMAVINRNEFDKALREVDRDTSDYYVLGYHSKDPETPRSYRSLDVKVRREGLTVWARKGYSTKK